MIDIHDGDKVNDCLVMKTGRIDVGLLEPEYIEAFYVGFSDRLHEEHDGTSYIRVSEINTILELFYYLGYKISGQEIEFSGMVLKNLPDVVGFTVNIILYLDRFNIVSFYERNSQAIPQPLP